MAIKFLDEVKSVKDGKNGAKLAKVKLEVTPLRSIRVTSPKDGKGYGYQLPSGSYYKDGVLTYTRPLFPVDATALQAAIQTAMEGGGGGTLSTFKTPVEGVEGYLTLDSVNLWVDVTLLANGTLLFPHTEKKVTKDGKEGIESSMVIPVKKDDPERQRIIDAIAQKV